MSDCKICGDYMVDRDMDLEWTKEVHRGCERQYPDWETNPIAYMLTPMGKKLYAEGFERYVKEKCLLGSLVKK